MDEQELTASMTMMSSNGGDEMSTSTSSSTNGSGGTNGCGKRTAITSPDPTSYVAKARVTRPTPPPPSYNPMQFVQIKPCNLYQTAQEQLKKAEEVKKLKEVKKEEPEEWQNNLDNWKSSRRKRVEHIIDRVVEVKKLELEEHDRMRRKSKTFSEMIEERAERGGPRRAKLATLAVYNEDEANDLSDLGIGTSSASGKSSLSEDYDNNSVMSDNAAELDKAIGASEQQNINRSTSHPQQQQQQQQQQEHQHQEMTTREYISSPGYDTSSSTAPASSPDPCEYTYEGAIQDYKARVTRAATGGMLPSTATSNGSSNTNSNGIKLKESTAAHEEQQNGVDVPMYPTRRGSKIEDRLIGFEVTSPSDNQEVVEKQKVDVPKIDISKRKEIFESQATQNNGAHEPKSNGGTTANATTPTSNGGGGAPRVVLRERFKLSDDAVANTKTNGNADAELPAAKKEMKRLSGDITSIRDRMQSLEQQKNSVNASKIVDVPVPPLKERLSSLQNAVTKEDVKKPPVALVDARQLEIMKNEEARMKQQRQVEQQHQQQQPPPPKAATTANANANANATRAPEHIEVIVESAEVDRDDSGINTSSDDIDLMQKEQEQQLNAAIAALALEEKQLEEAANAVNQIEAEFAELTDLNPAPLATASPLPKLPTAVNKTTAAVTAKTITATAAPPPSAAAAAAAAATNNDNTRNMEFSINEALELALEAIDRETRTENTNTKTNTITTLNQQQQQIKKQQKTQNNQNEMPNKTDEEKNQIQKIRNNNKQQQHQQQQQLQHQQQQQQQQQQMKKKNDEDNIAAVNDDGDDVNVNGKKQHKVEEEEEEEGEGEDENEEETITNKINEAIIAKEPIYENISSAISMHEVEIVVKSIPNNKQQQQQTIENNTTTTTTKSNSNNKTHNQINNNVSQNNINDNVITTTTTTATTAANKAECSKREEAAAATATLTEKQQQQQHEITIDNEPEPYYQVPKSSEPYYDAPKHLRPVPVYENIEIFYTNSMDNATTTTTANSINGLLLSMEPPKEKPPPPPTESPPPLPCDNDELDSVGGGTTDTWSSSENTYETIATRRQTTVGTAKATTKATALVGEHLSPPIKRMNSTKRIKKELRNKRSSFLGIEAGMDDEESYLEMTVAPPPDIAQLLQEERRLEKQLYIKAGLCDSSDTGESRDSGVSENHSRQSSEHYTNSSEEHDPQLDTPPHSLKVSNPEVIYQNEALLTAAQTPLLQTVKGNSAESWTESATVAAAASQSLSEATATANAKMLSIEEKIREQEEVLRVERELLHFSQEELKRQRENLLLRENIARRELQHGAKMLMSANRRSLQDLHGVAGGMSLHNGNGAIGNGMLSAFQPPAAKLQVIHQQQQQKQQALPSLQQQQQQQQQQIYANLPNLQTQYYQVETDYRKSMSDLNEFSKRLMLPPTPPTKPMRAMHIATNGHHEHNILIDPYNARQRHSLNMQSAAAVGAGIGIGGNVYGGSLVKIATMETPTAATRFSSSANTTTTNNNNYHHYQSAQNLSQSPYHSNSNGNLSTTTTAAPLSVSSNNNNINSNQVQHGNMTRNTLHALSATPKPKYTDGWVQVQNRKAYDTNLTNDAAWISAYQQKRKSMPDYQTGYNGNHWLVQEAEQRRLIEQQQQQQQQRRTLPGGTQKITASNGKPLPDSIIQTLTERVQSKGIGERKRFDNNYNQIGGGSHHANHAAHRHHNGVANNNNSSSNNELKLATNTQANNNNNNNNVNGIGNANGKEQEKVLSVSGKKKCSHCGDELGRGAAMIIESLLLFYHINCFKCCVCHVQLGDGLNGTDVRVRNQKLHCQNCYSSDDGIKFSCV